MSSRHRTPARHIGVALAAAALLAGCGDTAPRPAPATPATTAATPGTSPSTPAPAVAADPSASAQALREAEAGRISVPESGAGTTEPITLPGRDSDRHGRTVRYAVEIEHGLEAAAAGFPLAVRQTLTDARGWEPVDGVHFEHVTAEQLRAGERPDIRIIFASPHLTDERCRPAKTNGRLSCHNRGQVMVNAWRWIHGADTYGSDLADYRLYLVNHEVGHSIGHFHEHCPRPGAQAPVMLQQTLRLEGCRPYPYPAR